MLKSLTKMEMMLMQGLSQVSLTTPKALPDRVVAFLTHLNNIVDAELQKILQQETAGLGDRVGKYLLGELNKPNNARLSIGISEILQATKIKPIVVDIRLVSYRLCQRFFAEATREQVSGLNIDIESLSLTSRSEDEYEVELEKSASYLFAKNSSRKIANYIARIQLHGLVEFDETVFPLHPKAILSELMVELASYYDEDSSKKIYLLHAIAQSLQLKEIDKHFNAVMQICNIPEIKTIISKGGQSATESSVPPDPSQALPQGPLTFPNMDAYGRGDLPGLSSPMLESILASYYKLAQGYARIQPEYLAQHAGNMHLISRSVGQIPLQSSQLQDSHLLQLLPQADVINALSQFAAQQSNVGFDAAPITPATLRTYLRGNVPEGYKYGKSDTNIIDTVTALFDTLLNDKTMPNLVKVLLSRLQIVFLQVALQDAQLFQDPNHPARQTLNKMAVLGMHWDKKAPSRNNLLYGFLLNCVESVLKNYTSDPTIFVATNHKIDDFAQQFFAKQNIQEQKAVKAAEEKSKLVTLQQLVDRTIRKLILRQKLPLCVLQLIQSGWRQVLIARALATDVSAPVWDEELATMKALVVSTTPDKEDSEWLAKLEESRESLYVQIKEGLERVNFDVVWLDKLLLGLRKIHDELLEKRPEPLENMIEVKPANEVEADTTPVNLKNITVVSHVNIDSIVIDDEDVDERPQIELTHPMMMKTHHMPVNTLVDFKTESQDAPVRLKLVARLHVGSQLIFTNSKGIRAKQISENDFAQLMIDNKVSIIEKTTAVVDDALQKIMKALDKVAV